MTSFREMLRLVFITAASGGSQNFLGARWVAGSLRIAPRGLKRPVALRLLNVSPHYFARTQANSRLAAQDFLESEYRRNRESRRLITEGLISGYLKPEFICLDYGCGPGFLAVSVALKAAKVIACDISPGVLACAEAINSARNIEYRKIGADGAIPVKDGEVDLAYSFAVFQHLTDDVLRKTLAELRRIIKPGGLAVCHVVLDGAEGWKRESTWRDDKTLTGRLKWEINLHCFSRAPVSLERMIVDAGLKLRQLIPISDLGVSLAGDDVERQHLCVLTH
jgi:SAM-dependent methyltransferase